MNRRAQSRARGWALQVLYAWEAKGDRDRLPALLDEFLAERRIAPESRPYLRTLVDAVERHRESVDQLLQECLTNWRLERLSAIDRNVLRLAAAEMIAVSEVPHRVAIHEGIVLAEKYGTAESPRFVNGVLDALHRRLESGAGDGSPEGPT